MAITSEVLWLWFNRKPSFLFLFNSDYIVLFSVHVISVLLLFVIDIAIYLKKQQLEASCFICCCKNKMHKVLDEIALQFHFT